MTPAPLVHKMDYSFGLRMDPGRRWPGHSPSLDLNPSCLLLLYQMDSDLVILVIAFAHYLMIDRATSKIEAVTWRRATLRIEAMAIRHGEAARGSVIVTRNCCYLVHSF